MVTIKNSKEVENLRLDKWLWAARFFKTRTAAMKAVISGRVLLHGSRVKPAKLVHIGDKLTVRQGIYQYLITIERIDRRRRPAAEAKQLYCELEESIRAREALAAQYKIERLNQPSIHRMSRPNKKQRRQIIKFTRSE